MTKKANKKQPGRPTSVALRPWIEDKISRLRAVYGFNRLVSAGLLAVLEMDRDQLDNLILQVGEDVSDEFEADVRADAERRARKRGGQNRAADSA